MQITVSLIVDSPASADMNEIEQRVQEAGRQAMREAMRKAVRAVEEEKKTCSYCGSEVIRSEGTDQRIILTTFGQVALALRRLRCQGCQRRFRPSEACVKSLQGGNVTAALMLKHLCGAQISPEHVHRLTTRRGSQEAARQVAEAKAVVEPSAAQVRKQRETEWRGRTK
jgi:hypothetical protein